MIFSFILSLSFLFLPNTEKGSIIEISKKDIQKAEIIYDFTKTNKNCTISNFEISIVYGKKNKFPISIIGRTEKFTKIIKSALNEIEKGDMIYVEKIISISNCIQYQSDGKEQFVIKVI